MQITEVFVGRAIWFLDTTKLNPSRVPLGEMMARMKDRYRFQIFPTRLEDLDAAKGLAYQHGVFTFTKQIGVSLYIYNNGWIADTLDSTEASNAFLVDLAAWLSKDLGMRDAGELLTETRYDSQVEFESDINFASLTKLSEFTSLLRSTTKATSELSALLFRAEKGSVNFSVERRDNVAFAEKKYFSKALLPTTEHLRLLQEFERIFTQS
jgi:hypothetical protein